MDLSFMVIDDTELDHFIAKKMIIEKEAIVFFCDTSNKLGTAMGLGRQIREIQTNPIIIIADEFERYAANNEAAMKIFLDGKDSINNCLFLAATNYFNQVPDSLKNRPSRFKVVVEVKGITSKPLMRQMLSDISARVQPGLFSAEEIETIIKPLDKVTLDELKHLCLDKLTGKLIPTLSRFQSTKDKKKSDNNDDDFEGESWFDTFDLSDVEPIDSTI